MNTTPSDQQDTSRSEDATAQHATGPENLGIFGAPRQDALASIVVFLVALPLCMGIAIASGVPVAAGLITGIVGGLVVGWIAGCPLQVSGPAAGLTVIVYDVVQRFGLEMLGVIVLIGGAIQIVAGILHFGQWFRAVSPAVIKGMLAGIGVLIFASQFHVMMDDKPKGSGIENLLTIPQAVAKGLALPTMQSRDRRQFHTQMLHEVGELHRRQVDLYERVSERLPHHAQPPSEKRAEPDRSGGAPQGAAPSIQPNAQPNAQNWADLENVQDKIVSDLKAVSDRLRQFELERGVTEKTGSIADAAKTARAKGESALQAIRESRLVDIPQTQQATIVSLETLLARNKNHHLAAFLGVLTIASLLLWQGLTPKKLRVVPGPLVAVVVATVFAAILAVPVLYVEVPDNLWKGVHFPSLVAVQSVPWTELLQAGLMIAVVASAETLLCATAVDQMHQGPRTKYDRELFAQGVGNVVCGFLGALPMTGVIVRSSANVQAGARTRLSAILHGVWLLIFVCGLAFLLRLIPTASLAAMLVYTGYKLVNPKSIGELRKYGWGEVAIYAATVGTIVFTDLLTGVLVGIGLAAVKLLYTFSHLDVKLDIAPDRRSASLLLNGAATFIRLPRLAGALENVPHRAELHVNFEQLDYIDHACLDLLMNWARQHESTGGKLVIDWSSLHARFHGENGAKNGASTDADESSEADAVADGEPVTQNSRG